MDLNTIHPGHPLILPGRNMAAAYSFIINKFKSKLNICKASRLSHVGRLTLIKSVFASLPVYYMSNILLSQSIIKKNSLPLLENFCGREFRRMTRQSLFSLELGMIFVDLCIKED